MPQYLIFSTLQAVRKISGVKYTKVGAFDAKVKNEGYIRGMSIRSAFVSLGSFMENFQGQPFLPPSLGGDGTRAMKGHVSWITKMQLHDAIQDSGKFVGAILAEPEKFEAKRLCAAVCCGGCVVLIRSMLSFQGDRGEDYS